MNAPTSQTAAIASHVWFDTAAQPYLYREDVYDGLLRGPFRETIVMGSDWPLISQKRQIEAIRRSVPEAEAEMVLGSNGEPLLGVRVGRRSG
jgi:predicted TIM-barrel fold metal-dependent hydrolase